MKQRFYQNIREYAVLLNRLSRDPSVSLQEAAEKKAEELRQYVISRDLIDGVYWWNVPVYDVLSVMEDNCAGECNTGDWRIESEYICKVNSNRVELYVEEEGHYSNFSTGKQVDYSTVSKYSAAEREAMVKDFNRRIDERENWDILTTDGAVYSPDYGKVYDSAYDFYNSAEHQMKRWSDSSSYADSLVDEKKTTVTTVRSNSIHYKALYSVGGFSVADGGILTALIVSPAELVGAQGNKDYAGQLMSNMSGRVLLADYLSKDNNIKTVPAELLGHIVCSEANSYTEALHNAAMIAKLSSKLSFEGFEEKPLVPTAEEAAECRALMQKVSGGTQLTEAESVTLLYGIINDVFPLNPADKAWLKTSLMYDLATMNVDDTLRCLYYCRLCADTVDRAMEYIRNPAAQQQLTAIAVVTAGLYVETHVKNKLFEECVVYADILEKYYSILKETDPKNPVLSLKRTYDKLIKKMSKYKTKRRK